MAQECLEANVSDNAYYRYTVSLSIWEESSDHPMKEIPIEWFHIESPLKAKVEVWHKQSVHFIHH